MTFFDFNIPFQVTIGKLRLPEKGEKIWWQKKSPIIEKPDCRRSLTTPHPHPTPPGSQLQLELFSPLQNSNIYTKWMLLKVLG